ncbi:unnamed protein product [Ectocarpus sp. CCAP 1310/34]|nr:unnamed protein product [Ectocarpus sp. CCAP 1310/34]
MFPRCCNYAILLGTRPQTTGARDPDQSHHIGAFFPPPPATRTIVIPHLSENAHHWQPKAHVRACFAGLGALKTENCI